FCSVAIPTTSPDTSGEVPCTVRRCCPVTCPFRPWTSPLVSELPIAQLAPRSRYGGFSSTDPSRLPSLATVQNLVSSACRSVSSSLGYDISGPEKHEFVFLHGVFV